MGTVIRAELSSKNKYWIDKHRYYELKHFCMQYQSWKKTYLALDGFSKASSEAVPSKTNKYSDPTARCAEAKAFYLDRIELVEQCAWDADPELSNYILKGVTEECSYEYLKSSLNIPCSRDTYYDRYRKFFWLLDKERR
jgi:hypothetical protein